MKPYLADGYRIVLLGNHGSLAVGKTVEDAMNNCEKVHKKSSKRNYKDDNVNMKTPDWFDKEIDKSNVSDGEENQLEELLKEYK